MPPTGFEFKRGVDVTGGTTISCALQVRVVMRVGNASSTRHAHRHRSSLCSLPKANQSWRGCDRAVLQPDCLIRTWSPCASPGCTGCVTMHPRMQRSHTNILHVHGPVFTNPSRTEYAVALSPHSDAPLCQGIRYTSSIPQRHGTGLDWYTTHRTNCQDPQYRHLPPR